jgi:DNA-binding NarL/FixJ family response regulator
MPIKTSNAKMINDFSDREKRVIRFICRQYTSKEIGEKLGKSHRTVEEWRERIMDKMKVKNSAGIAVYAIKHGIFKL